MITCVLSAASQTRIALCLQENKLLKRKLVILGDNTFAADVAQSNNKKGD